MPLSGDQIKAIIDSQVKNYERRLEELAAELALLRSQPIAGSRELQRRLTYLEHAQAEQQAKRAALLDLQQILQTLEGYAGEG